MKFAVEFVVEAVVAAVDVEAVVAVVVVEAVHWPRAVAVAGSHR